MHGKDPGEERRHLAAVEKDLVAEFATELDEDTVVRRWSAIVREFDGAPIRDFVPVLARKRARQELRQAVSA